MLLGTFSLNMSGLEKGHSGAWVVEAHTSKVYGHVVASDALGDGYIIPMLNILACIRAVTGAKVVDLATTLDVACAQAMHLRLSDHSDSDDDDASRTLQRECNATDSGYASIRPSKSSLCKDQRPKEHTVFRRVLNRLRGLGTEN